MNNTIRILSLLFALTLSACTFAHAETFDLSGLSYDELIALHKQVSLALMQSDEWREVTVPVGTYIVGKDIPAGDYTVTYSGTFQASVEIRSLSGLLTNYLAMGDHWDTHSIGKLTLTDGQTVRIVYGNVVFAPYKGLGF